MFKRRDQLIEDAVEVLDQHFIQNGQSVLDTLASLGNAESEFINQEIEKCITDERYYLDNYHVIAAESGFKTLDPFYESQEIFFSEFLRLQRLGRSIKIIVLKARQLGLSTISEGLIFHRAIFSVGCNVMIVAQDAGQADYLFSMSRTAYDSLPWWMRPEARYESKGRYFVFDRKDPNARFANPGLRSQILVEAANKMTGVSVGKTLRASHMSELAEWANGSILARQIFPALSGDGVLAILESTGKGRDNFFYKFWRDCMEGVENPEFGSMDWSPVFIESFRIKKYSIPIAVEEKFELTNEEQGIRAKVLQTAGVEISNEHLKWRRAKIAEFVAAENDESGFFEQYPATSWVEAFQSTGLCVFNKKKLMTFLETTCIRPKWYGEIGMDTEAFQRSAQKIPKIKLAVLGEGEHIPESKNDGSRFRVWKAPEKGVPYYISVDVAQGIQGGDYSCVEVIKIGSRMRPDEQVAEWHGWIDAEPFAYVVAAIGWWYNEGQIAVEMNDVGRLTNTVLFRTIEYSNVYRHKNEDKVRHFLTDWFGWLTTHHSKELLFAKMSNSINERRTILRSESLVDELMQMSKEKNKFISLRGNDDRAMAYLIGNYCAHDSDWGISASLEERPETPEEIAALRQVDFYNTEFSPIHDPRSIRGHSVNRNIPEDAALYNTLPGGAHDPEDEWRNL